MDEALRSAGWICVAIIAGAYFTFVGADFLFNPKTASSTPMVVRDVLRKGEHHLYGKIIVQSACEEVTVTTKKLEDSEYELEFTTWTEPVVRCIREPTERVFDTVIFAPSVGVHFIATVDKTPIPIAVYPIIQSE